MVSEPGGDQDDMEAIRRRHARRERRQATREDANRRRAHQPGRQVDRVDAVVDDVATAALDLQLPRAPAARPQVPGIERRMQRAGLADRTLPDRIRDLQMDRLEAGRLPEQQRHPGALDGFEHRLDLVQAQGDRLLEVDRLPGLRRGDGDGSVAVRRGADVDRVDRRVAQHRVEVRAGRRVARQPRQGLGPFRVPIDDMRDRHAGDAGERVHMIAGDRSRADDADAMGHEASQSTSSARAREPG